MSKGFSHDSTCVIPELPSDWWMALNLPKPIFGAEEFRPKWDRFRDLIRSPADGSALRLDGASSMLVDAGGNRFPVWNGILLLSPIGLQAMSRGAAFLRDHVHPIAASDLIGGAEAPSLFVLTSPTKVLASEKISVSEAHSLNLPLECEPGALAFRDGATWIGVDNEWYRAELEVETRIFDRLAQASRIQKRHLPDELRADLPLTEQLFLHRGFVDPALQETCFRFLTSWPSEPLGGDQLSRLTSQRAPADPQQRGQRLVGIAYRDANEPYLKDWLAIAELDVGSGDALIWSGGAGYLSDALLTAGMSRTVNCDERLATLPCLPDQGPDELFVWSDASAWPVRKEAFRVIVSHRHTVVSRLEEEGLRQQLNHVAAHCEPDGTAFVSLNSTLSGKPAHQYGNVALRPLFAAFAELNLFCAQFAAIGSNISFWFTKDADTAGRIRRFHNHALDVIRPGAALRDADRPLYYKLLASHACDALSQALSEGVERIAVVGDTTFDAELKLLLNRMKPRDIELATAPSPEPCIVTGTACRTGQVQPANGVNNSWSAERSFPFHSGDGDNTILPTANYFLEKIAPAASRG